MTNPDTPDQVKVEQLLPCPFGCPDGPLLHRVSGIGKLFRVSCANCDCSRNGRWTEAEAIAAWNTRAPANSTGLLREARGYMISALVHRFGEWCPILEEGIARIDTHLANQSDSTGDTPTDGVRDELAALTPTLPEFGFDTFVMVPEALRDRILAALSPVCGDRNHD